MTYLVILGISYGLKLQKTITIFQINTPKILSFVKRNCKLGTKNTYLGITGMQFWKTIAIFEIDTVGPKISYLGIFRLKLLKTIARIEISSFKVVKIQHSPIDQTAKFGEKIKVFKYEIKMPYMSEYFCF